MGRNSQLHSSLIEAASAAGFPLAGALDLDTDAIVPHIERYRAWIQSGKHGEMGYLSRGLERRLQPTKVFAEAQSVLCVGLPYSAKPAGSSEVRYARYLQSRDYHEVLSEKLEAVMKSVAENFSDLRWKVCVDTSAVLERSWAALAGIGWIGKNTMLIHPQFGSYFFIGTVLLNMRVEHAPNPLPDYCGSCTRCLKSCPTSALENHDLDSRKCISYWTLEKRGELEISHEQRRAIGNWIAGCDICQEACPFNLKTSKNPLETEPNASDLNRLEDLSQETEKHYRERIHGSALSRIKWDDFKRNLDLVKANS